MDIVLMMPHVTEHTGNCDEGCQAGYIGSVCEKGFKLFFMPCTCC